MCPRCFREAAIGYEMRHEDRDVNYAESWVPASCACGWCGTTDDLASFLDAQKLQTEAEAVLPWLDQDREMRAMREPVTETRVAA